MPVKSKFSILGLDLTKDTPTVAEWTAKWGEDSIRTEATSNVWYRSTAAEIRETFLHGREEEKNEDGSVKRPGRQGVDDLTGIPRKTKTITLKTKNPDGTAKTSEVWDPDESEQGYFKRVCATLVEQQKYPNLDAAKASFQSMLQSVADEIDFDASKPEPSERKAKGIPKAFMDAANAALAKGTQQKLAKFLSKAIGVQVGKTENGQFVVTAEELALAMKKDDQLRAEARNKEYAAMAGA